MRLILTVLLLATFSTTRAAMLAVSGDAFEKSELFVNGQFGGIMGDVLDLAPGKHSITFEGLHSYQFSVTLEIADKLAVTSQAMRLDDCIDGRVSRFVLKTWPAPAIQVTDARATLQLSKPVFTDRGDQGECRSEPSMLTLKRLGKIALTVASTPDRAEVWIKGRLAGSTNSAIVIPYTNGDRARIQIVFRKAGYANCLRYVAVPEDGKDSAMSAECVLQAVRQGD